MSKASDKLEDVTIMMPDGWHHTHYYKSSYGPGQIFEKKFSEETKEILRSLKSDDIKNIRPDRVFISREECHRQARIAENSKLMMEFDAKMKKYPV